VLMQGKRGLVMGIANNHSIGWGIAQALGRAGAQLAFTYQGEALGKRVKPLAASLGSSLVLPCDVEDIATLDAVFSALRDVWGGLDFLVHSIGYSDKNELKGRYADTTRENFSRTMVISVFSFTEAAKRAAALMPSWVSPRRRSRRACAISPPISARKASASTLSRQGPSARSPAPASPMRASCSTSRRRMRRCAAT
jgi:enoyl-[acyl-carrier-protein] reductase (NADH)